LTLSRTRIVSVARSRSLRLSRDYLASRSTVYGLSSLPWERAHLADLSIVIIADGGWNVNRKGLREVGPLNGVPS
ncbi:MAG TPA: hypothetical protein PKK90_05305, partial [Anaerolineaceae bacterium]|nr:hypothetical protein [Anaerolineaceae bacterium]